MKKMYFRLPTGPIGLEALNARFFLYYIGAFRDKGIEPVAVFTARPHNQTLNTLIKRKYKKLGVKVIDISGSKLLSVLYHRVIMKPTPDGDTALRNVSCKGDTSIRYLDCILNRSTRFVEMFATPLDFEAINSLGDSLVFTPEEDKQGVENLKKMGVNKSYVCVHSRDGGFYKKTNPKDQPDNIISSRNIEFMAYQDACRYLGVNGIQSLRMGATYEEINGDIFNENIVDYAGKYRTEFMDIWSIANCKFFLGCSSGLFVVAYMFGKAAAVANMESILYAVPYRTNDIYLPQRIWDKNRKRFLTYREISDREIGAGAWTQERYGREGLECIKSDSEEILELCREINEVIDGRYQYTEEDNYLQQQFRNTFKIHQAPYHSPARAGKEFLKRNRALFLIS